MYKLKFYNSLGNFDHDEKFNTFEDMDKRYMDVFEHEKFGLNPTAWELIDSEWYRILGY